MNAVTLYTSNWCPYCSRAKSVLERKGLTWTEINLEDEPERRSEMIARSGGLRSVPQIFIGDRHVGGFDELRELDLSGELDRLLGAATREPRASGA